jgi:hypothetical protein
MCLTRARHASNVENEQLGCPAAVVPLTCAQNFEAFAEPSGKRTNPTERSIITTTSGTVSFDIATSRWLIDFRCALFVNYQTARFHQAKSILSMSVSRHCAVSCPRLSVPDSGRVTSSRVSRWPLIEHSAQTDRRLGTWATFSSGHRRPRTPSGAVSRV